MQSIAVLRQLWRARLLVGLGVAVAIVIQTLMSYHVSLGFPPTFASRQYDVGIATAGVLVDSHSSQVVDLGGGQSKADVTLLSARARLLASLMATSPLKEQIARRAGIPADTLLTVAPSTVPGIEPKPISTGTQVEADDPDASILTLYVNEVLPIITATSQSRKPAVAAGLSTAAVEELTLFLKSVAARDRVPDALQLVVKPLGSAQATTERRGPRRLFAIVAMLFIIAAWCAGIVFFSRLAKLWRQSADEQDADGTAASAAAPTLAAWTEAPEKRSQTPPRRRGRAPRDPAGGPADVVAELPDHSALERPEYPRSQRL